VLDDYGLSAQDAETATRTLTQKGLAPTTAVLASLSDEYCPSIQRRRRTHSYLRTLARRVGVGERPQHGSTAIRAQSAAVEDSLVLTQQGVDQAREYALAVDGLDDAFMAFKINLGGRSSQDCRHC